MNRHEKWHHALDVQMDTQKWSRSDEGKAMLISFFASLVDGNATDLARDLDNKSWEAGSTIAHNYTVTLYRGDTIFITADMHHLIMQAAHDLPDDAAIVDEHTMLSPFGFVFFEEPMQGEDKHGINVVVNGFAWSMQTVQNLQNDGKPHETVCLYMLTDPTDFRDDTSRYLTPALKNAGLSIPPLVPAHMYPAIIGQDCTRLNEETQGVQLVKGMLKFFIAMNLLAQQKIGQPKEITPHRPVRKRAEKWDMHNQRYITLITLRRNNTKVVRDPDEPPVEWSHRWMVGGHWRKQPDKHGWHWVYIYEYVKGPQDKPLILRDRRVFDFRR
jgi:hypothetical protein